MYSDVHNRRKNLIIVENPHVSTLLEQNVHVSCKALDLKASGQTSYVLKYTRRIYYMGVRVNKTSV